MSKILLPLLVLLLVGCTSGNESTIVVPLTGTGNDVSITCKHFEEIYKIKKYLGGWLFRRYLVFETINFKWEDECIRLDYGALVCGEFSMEIISTCTEYE